MKWEGMLPVLVFVLCLFVDSGACRVMYGKSAATGDPLVIRFDPAESPFSSQHQNLAWFLEETFNTIRVGDLHQVSSMPAIFGDKTNVIVIYTQSYFGIPVQGASLKAVFDLHNRLLQASFKLVDSITLDPNPSVSPELAIKWAMRDAHLMSVPSPLRKLLLPRDLITHKTSLKVYRSGLTTGSSGANHLIWEIQFRSASSTIMDPQFAFLVDAHSADVLGVRNLLKGSLYRELRDYPSTSPYWVEGDSMPKDDVEGTAFLNAAGDYYTTLYNMYKWRSYDNRDSPLIGNVNMEDKNVCPNAYFSDSDNMTYFCTGLSRYDIATHELGHALSSCLDNGYYEYMSGALQEAFSDTIAETFSQFWNGSGYYDIRDPRRTCLNTSVATQKRWIVGDDCELFGDGLRDMYNPTCGDLPETISTMQCFPYDMNGVHYNCGPPSVLFSLLSDGGYFYGPLYPGIGLLKAWHIFFQAKYEYQSPSETFSEYAGHLQMACDDLADEEGNLIDQYGTITDEHVIPDDCDILDDLIDAVGMTDTPCSNYVFWGAYPSYIPVSGGVTAIYTSGCSGCTTFMKLGTETYSSESEVFTYFGTTTGWNQYSPFQIPELLGSNMLVNFSIASDSNFANTPALDDLYSLPMTIEYYEQPTFSGVSPDSGSVDGGYWISIKGEGFQAFPGPCSPITGFYYDCLVCVWQSGESGVYADYGLFVSSTEIQCLAPAVSQPSIWNISVSLNLHSIADGYVEFHYEDDDNLVLIIVVCVIVGVGIIAGAVVIGIVAHHYNRKRQYDQLPNSTQIPKSAS